MEKKFIVPATLFLGPVVIWIAAFVLLLSGSAPGWPGGSASTVLFAVLGVLVLVSGHACMKAGGPRMGNVIRASTLLVLSGLTWWKFGLNNGVAMIVSVAALACLAVFGKYREQEKR